MSARSLKPSESVGPRRGSGVLRIDPAALAPFRSEGQAHWTDTPTVNRAESARPHLDVKLHAESATLLLSCPSAHDVAATLLAQLQSAGARVLDSEQHTDAESACVFQRLHGDISRVVGGAARLERVLGELARQQGIDLVVERSTHKKRVAIFVSKFDHCLYDLLLRHQAGDLECEIPLIVSNHPDLERVAGQFGVAFRVIGKNAAEKTQAEALELSVLEEHDVELVVLARYMQVLSDAFCARFERRVINIHHSFLPAFVGAKPYHQARERGVKLIGATAHYASAALDQGPIIEQDVVRCSHKDSAQDLVRKGRDLERQVLARAVGWHLDNRVIVHGNKTVIFD